MESLSTQSGNLGTPSAMSPAPATQHERVLVLDVLRGIALLGILMVNMGDFQLLRSPIGGYIEAPNRVEYWLASLVQILFDGKFYPIFSLLFGVGLALQIARLEARGRPATGIMVRRLLVLLVMGALHAIFIWRGDILFVYALIGLLALLFQRCQPRTLLWWSGGLWLSLFLCCTVPCAGYGLLVSGTQSAEMENILAEMEQETLKDREAYLTESYLEVLPKRVRDWGYVLASLLIAFPEILMLFLLGIYFSKIGLFTEPWAHARVLRWMLVGLPIGLLASFMYNSSLWASTLNGNWGALFIALAVYVSLTWLQAMGYVALLLMVWERWAWFRALLTPLAYAGRMALTNYLMQSVVCTMIFYGYGLELAKNATVAQGIALTFGIYLAQVILSALWLRGFQYGPMEWLWRVLTYGRWIPIRS